MRRKGYIGEFVSVYLTDVQKAVYVASDGGRVCRPLLIVENGANHLPFKSMFDICLGRILLTQDHIKNLGTDHQLEDLLAQGIIEYVDVSDLRTEYTVRSS